MSAIGSNSNPYLYSDYTRMYNNNTWPGGWVRDVTVTIYISHENLRYEGKGEYSNPFPQEIFNEMTSHEIWIGGWVYDYNHRKKYYDRYEVEYEDNYGTSSTPWPISIYAEMCNIGIWEGGWVEYRDGTRYFIQNFDLVEVGSGCGCSSGGYSSGCDSSGSSDGSSSGGCGSSGCGDDNNGCGSNSNDYQPDARVKAGSTCCTFYNGKIELTVSWTSGCTRGGCDLSTISCRIIPKVINVSCVNDSLWGRWIQEYEAEIGGLVTFVRDGEVIVANLLGATLIIPKSCRVEKDDAGL